MVRTALVGSRIRRLRTDRGLKQTQLAQATGISASYLNLIEHNRRPIGGKLIADLANALEVTPEQLSAGVEPNDLAQLRGAAGAFRGTVMPEVARADEFALRFPGWAGLVVAQAEQTKALEQRLGMMSDRVHQDPALAASLHNILSTVTAIRSTAGILAGDVPVEPTWQERFHRNLYEESQRLAHATEALVGDLEDGGADTDQNSPAEMVEVWLGSWTGLSALEPDGEGVEALVGAARSHLKDQTALELALAFIEQVAHDEATLPLAALRKDQSTGVPDPFEVGDRHSVQFATALRRLAALPELGAGYFQSDDQGALVLQRPLKGFAVPRFGASKLLWPLYAALEAPGKPVAQRLGPKRRPWEQFDTWAVADTDAKGERRATMLVVPVQT